ncbi:MAG: thiamine pyrophosphate-binding protein [Pseudomonadota bacterium]
MGWSEEVLEVLNRNEVGTIATVPDAGLTGVLNLCDAAPDKEVVTLSSEEEGVGLMLGLWLGGRRGAIFMQSSGVGNCINALSVPAATRTPCVMLVTMRGQWGEFNPWQVPMGKATQPVMETMGVHCYSVEDTKDIAPAFNAACGLAFNGGFAAAVLIHQRALGTKVF